MHRKKAMKSRWADLQRTPETKKASAADEVDKTLAFLSAPGRARTYNLRFRRPTLYPIELRVRFCTVVGTRQAASGSGQVSRGRSLSKLWWLATDIFSVPDFRLNENATGRTLPESFNSPLVSSGFVQCIMEPLKTFR